MYIEIQNGKLRSLPQEIIKLCPTTNDLYGCSKGKVPPAAFCESDSGDTEHSCSEMCQPELCPAFVRTISRSQVPLCCDRKPLILNNKTFINIILQRHFILRHSEAQNYERLEFDACITHHIKIYNNCYFDEEKRE